MIEGQKGRAEVDQCHKPSASRYRTGCVSVVKISDFIVAKLVSKAGFFWTGIAKSVSESPRPDDSRDTASTGRL